eukprot:652103-Pleurochrysis_carterae.AAC.1
MREGARREGVVGKTYALAHRARDLAQPVCSITCTAGARPCHARPPQMCARDRCARAATSGAEKTHNGGWRFFNDTSMIAAAPLFRFNRI